MCCNKFDKTLPTRKTDEFVLSNEIIHVHSLSLLVVKHSFLSPSLNQNIDQVQQKQHKTTGEQYQGSKTTTKRGTQKTPKHKHKSTKTITVSLSRTPSKCNGHKSMQFSPLFFVGKFLLPIAYVHVDFFLSSSYLSARTPSQASTATPTNHFYQGKEQLTL